MILNKKYNGILTVMYVLLAASAFSNQSVSPSTDNSLTGKINTFRQNVLNNPEVVDKYNIPIRIANDNWPNWNWDNWSKAPTWDNWNNTSWGNIAPWTNCPTCN